MNHSAAKFSSEFGSEFVPEAWIVQQNNGQPTTPKNQAPALIKKMLRIDRRIWQRLSPGCEQTQGLRAHSVVELDVHNGP